MRRGRPSVAARAMGSMLKGSLVGAHASWLVALVAGWFIAGPTGVANAAVGGALVVFFFAAGQGLQLWAGELDPQTGMGVTLLSFLGRAALLGGVLLAASRSGAVEAAFEPVAFFVAVMAVLTGWLTGMFIVHASIQIPSYDSQPPQRVDAGSDQL